MTEDSALKSKIRDVREQIYKAIWQNMTLDNPRLMELNLQLDLLIIEWMRNNQNKYKMPKK